MMILPTGTTAARYNVIVERFFTEIVASLASVSIASLGIQPYAVVIIPHKP
jgi:hypothetical protein